MQLTYRDFDIWTIYLFQVVSWEIISAINPQSFGWLLKVNRGRIQVESKLVSMEVLVGLNNQRPNGTRQWKF